MTMNTSSLALSTPPAARGGAVFRPLGRLCAALCLLLAGQGVYAGSIWAHGQGRVQPLFTDQIAQKVGDSLTVVIDEESTIQNKTDRTMDKKSNYNLNTSGNVVVPQFVSTKTNPPTATINPPVANLSVASENKFEGDAEFDSSHKVTDLITATVQDVLPNGNLVIVGQRIREFEGDKQIVQVSGIVRPIDILFTNSISSDKVANFHVVYTAVGRETHFTRPNWFAAFLNAINPL
jgi:flagellar L-ring protein precursor FlgH